MCLMLVLYCVIISTPLNYAGKQKLMVEQQQNNNSNTTTATTIKNEHLNLWLEDLLGKKTSEPYNTAHEILDLNFNGTYYEEVPIYIEKTNDIKLRTQLDGLQSQGENIKDLLHEVDNKQGVIKLKKNSNMLLNGNIKAVASKDSSSSSSSEEYGIHDKENEHNEYTGDINEGIGNTNSTSIIESSNVHKVINSTLLTNKVSIPTIEHNKSVATIVRNPSSWVNDNLPSETTAQIEANTLRTTGIPLSTLTALSSDIHLLQGNNIYKHSYVTADQLNIFNSTDELKTTTKTTTIPQKNLILIEKLHKMPNSNLNITNGKVEIGNGMQVDPGNSNNCMIDLKEILQVIQPLEHMRVPQVPAFYTQNEQQIEIFKEIKSEFEKWNVPKPIGRILHQDIGISINCVIIHPESNTHIKTSQ